MSRKIKIHQRSATVADVQFGEKIRARRVEIGMSQAILGERLGVSFQQVQKYEKGVNRVSAARLGMIAKALDIGTDYFLNVASKEETAFTHMITDRASQRLLTAFHKIEDPATRYKVVGLLESITQHAA